MREITLIEKFGEHATAINAVISEIKHQNKRILSCEARIRAHEKLLLGRWALLRFAFKNLFAPDKARLELLKLHQEYGFVPLETEGERKTKGKIEIKEAIV